MGFVALPSRYLMMIRLMWYRSLQTFPALSFCFQMTRLESMRLVVLSSVNRNTMYSINLDFFDTGNTEGITLKLLPDNFPLRLLVQTPVNSNARSFVYRMCFMAAVFSLGIFGTNNILILIWFIAINISLIVPCTITRDYPSTLWEICLGNMSRSP